MHMLSPMYTRYLTCISHLRARFPAAPVSDTSSSKRSAWRSDVPGLRAARLQVFVRWPTLRHVDAEGFERDDDLALGNLQLGRGDGDEPADDLLRVAARVGGCEAELSAGAALVTVLAGPLV